MPSITDLKSLDSFVDSVDATGKRFEELQKELIQTATESQKLISSFLLAQVDIRDFSNAVKTAVPTLSSMSKLGAKGTGQAIGQSITGGAIGSAIGGLGGSIVGTLASELQGAIGKSFDNAMNSVRQGLEYSVKTGLMAGFEGAANLAKNRQAAAGELESELGMSAAFMSQDQIKAVWKQRKMLADIRTQGQFNVQQAIADEGSLGLGETASNVWQGLLSTVGLGTNPASESADNFLRGSEAYANSAKGMNNVFYSRSGY